ncbi:MAG: tRNA pseudouridine(55) synthase TruB [Elainella sp.]
MQGFLNLNKPAGLTSHDCVARVRRLLKLKRVGHGGTLDPAAVGVLPIALGRATRLLQYLSHTKAYRARIRFGLTTSTDDLEGEVLSQTPAAHLDLPQIQLLLPQFEGTIQQIPPSYSAIQVGGKRLYELARAGQAVAAPVRTVEVARIEILGWQPGEQPELEVAIACGGGTYIRSIARDLGAALGVGGTLAHLIRTASSGFLLDQSLTLEAFADQLAAQTFCPIPPTAALSHLPQLYLLPDQTRRWQQGQPIPAAELAVQPESAELKPAQPTQILGQLDSEFLGIGELKQREAGLFLVSSLVWL